VPSQTTIAQRPASAIQVLEVAVTRLLAIIEVVGAVMVKVDVVLPFMNQNILPFPFTSEGSV